ncbi:MULTISPECIES: bifunctional UDP-N-acetylglucosamine diphosphorylase/glucosamine-1-phosphate N-acetyltransferase GlmU [unclassified Roseitalea]|uniref:bifunctional UDP-N-acetylglucosamine diphosphorylase/glucosamine-1-phosphate N-acetyltransferase GlmU n=1 Tax=unclassified Roseitalea TaxID=2639107 RepID=UPI00273E0A08|nr:MULTISPECIES: bifunctional UDP-N-acetylglucosamine diphosphorylase/glucosamine-1-phosphate N-acetyltransferase GlmU [unclassified Roseitalea]
MARSCLTIVLAAGAGTRMKSDRPKVLHEVAGLPMVAHVTAAARAAGADRLAVVVGHGADAVRAGLGALEGEARFFEQAPQLGTAHAVQAARAAIDEGADDVVVLFGDTPLIEAETLAAARARLAEGADLVVVGFRPADPHGYGRLIERDGELVAIREHRDASAAERAVGLCNGGLMAFAGRQMGALLDAIGNDNAKGEYYMTDAVAIAHGRGLDVRAIEAPVEQVLGVNTPVELADAEAIWQARRRRALMLSGVAMTAPETVFLNHDTQIAPGARIEPNVVFGPGARVQAGATIRAFSHIEGAHVGPGAVVGPYARLRPGAVLGADARVGNFVEVKNAAIETGAKVNHLSYIGDASVGEKANIGAGTITCNYDGYNKHRTEIGAGAFIGSNSSLVAPVEIGANAYVASGSVITRPVPDDSVGFGRARQENKQGFASVLRQRFSGLRDRLRADSD